MKNCHGLIILMLFVKNVSKTVIYVIYKVKHMLENNHLYMSYGSLILPYLSYACEIWRNTYKSQLHTLMLLWKKAIRNIAKSYYLDHMHPLFVQSKCLKCLDIVKLKTLIIIYKAKDNMLAINLQFLFIIIEEIHS